MIRQRGRTLLPLAVSLVLMLLLGVFGTQQTARADGPTVPTEATVSAIGVPPNIECKWELPDMVPLDDLTINPYPDPTLEYGTSTNIHLHDDAMAVRPSVDPACSGPPATLPSQPNGVMNMTQARPNPDDLPEMRRIQLWMAVDHPNGISNIADVYWKIFHPDGSFKVQVHGVRVPLADIQAGKLGNSSTAGTMFEAASHTGQIAAAAIDDPNVGLVAKALQQEKAIYYAEFNVSKEQPCGAYKVEAHAVGVGGVEDVLVNYLDIQCFIYGEIDFNTVNWGGITPGLTDIVSGDLLWDVPADNKPTIRNVGNHGMGPTVHFTTMCQVGADGNPIPGAKCIDQFDVAFGRSAAALQWIDPVLASTVVKFDETRERVLCSNELGKMDFSIHPPSTLPTGIYKGTVNLTFYPVHRICSTDQEVHP